MIKQANLNGFSVLSIQEFQKPVGTKKGQLNFSFSNDTAFSQL
jgi:hypothetical protein